MWSFGMWDSGLCLVGAVHCQSCFLHSMAIWHRAEPHGPFGSWEAQTPHLWKASAPQDELSHPNVWLSHFLQENKVCLLKRNRKWIPFELPLALVPWGRQMWRCQNPTHTVSLQGWSEIHLGKDRCFQLTYRGRRLLCKRAVRERQEFTASTWIPNLPWPLHNANGGSPTNHLIWWTLSEGQWGISLGQCRSVPPFLTQTESASLGIRRVGFGVHC